MEKIIAIGNEEPENNEWELVFKKTVYVPFVTVGFNIWKSIVISDSVESFQSLLNEMEKGDSMLNISIGDDDSSITFTRPDADSNVEVVIKDKTVTLVQQYSIEDLKVALRFMTSE